MTDFYFLTLNKIEILSGFFVVKSFFNIHFFIWKKNIYFFSISTTMLYMGKRVTFSAYYFAVISTNFLKGFLFFFSHPISCLDLIFDMVDR